MVAGKTPKGTRTKTRIIQSSIELINEKGFQYVTLNDICVAADVAPGTFYHYFSSTKDILKEILKIEGEDLIEYYETLKSLTPLKKLESVLTFQLDYYEKKGKEVVSQIYKAELLAGTGYSNIDELLPFQQFIASILFEGQSSGEFSSENSPKEDAILIISLLAYYSFRWITESGDTALKTIAYGHIDKMIKQVILSR